MKDTYGRSLPLPSMRFDLESSSWRTCEATSLWDLEMSSPSFPEWGMTLNGELFELPTPERPTVGQGSSSLPTPLARDSREMPLYRTDEFGPNASDTLSRALANQMLPTPTAADGTKMSSNSETSARRMQKGNQASLTDIVQTEMLPPGYLLPTPVANDSKENIIGPANHRPQDEDSLARALHHLLPTPRAQARDVIYAREDYHGNLEEALAFLPGVNALLPTPTVMDMGSNYTPEEWEAWKLKQKEAHRNGNGHGASLTQEALSIGASTQGQFFDGSECSEGLPLIPLSPE
jgi:hypothetical protein